MAGRLIFQQSQVYILNIEVLGRLNCVLLVTLKFYKLSVYLLEINMEQILLVSH